MSGAKAKTKKGPVWLMGRLAMVGIMAYLVVALVAGQIEVSQKNQQLADVQALVQQQTEENEELQRIVDSDDENAYIEKIARELGYGYPDERVYVDISGE